MPYFIRIGVIKGNKSGVGSRGWYIRRRGTSLVVRWGAVAVVRNNAGNPVQLAWADWNWPQEKIHPCGNVDRANARAKQLIAAKAHSRDGPYEKLPCGVKIKPY